MSGKTAEMTGLMPGRKTGFNPQAWVYLAGILALLIMAVLSVGWLHPDEHFQILEFARWKLDPSNPAPLPWEFYSRMRPAIQPALAVFLSELMSLAGYRDPFSLALVLRFLSAGLSFTALWMIFRRYEPDITDPFLKRQFVLLSFLLWFTLYLAVRFSSETWSGALFIMAFIRPFSGRSHENWRFFSTGLLLGLAFLFRYQAGFMVAGLMLWFLIIRKENRCRLLLMLAGLLAAAGAGILVDRWFYGEWALTAWNYFEQNILADKISGFGIQPWYFYFTELTAQLIPPFSVVIILAFLLVFIFRPKDVLTWTLLPFILVHLAIGHKETRFLFPLCWFVPVMLIKGAEVVSSRFGYHWIRRKLTKLFTTAFWIVNLLLLTALFFMPADEQVNLYRVVHRHPEPVTLYYIRENPYRRALMIGFYRKPGLTTTEVTNVEALDTLRGTCFLAMKTSRQGLTALKHRKVHLVYSSLPEFVKRFNINNWLDRTQVWYLYRLE